MNLFSESKYCWNYNWEKLYKRLGVFKQPKHLKTSQNVYWLARTNDRKVAIHSQRADDACTNNTFGFNSHFSNLLLLQLSKIVRKKELYNDCHGTMSKGFPMSILQQEPFPKKYFERNDIIEDWTCCSCHDLTQSFDFWLWKKIGHSCLMWWKFRLVCYWLADWWIANQLVDRWVCNN